MINSRFPICDFMDSTPNPYIFSKKIRNILDLKGFNEIFLDNKSIPNMGYFITSNYSIIVYDKKDTKDSVVITSQMDHVGFMTNHKLEVLGNKHFISLLEVGSVDINSFFNTDLRFSGYYTTKENRIYEYDSQTGIASIIASKDDYKSSRIEKVSDLKAFCGNNSFLLNNNDDICSSQIYVTGASKTKEIGGSICGPYVKGRSSVYCALDAFLSSKSDSNTRILCMFNDNNLDSHGQHLQTFLKLANISLNTPIIIDLINHNTTNDDEPISHVSVNEKLSDEYDCQVAFLNQISKKCGISLNYLQALFTIKSSGLSISPRIGVSAFRLSVPVIKSDSPIQRIAKKNLDNLKTVLEFIYSNNNNFYSKLLNSQ